MKRPGCGTLLIGLYGLYFVVYEGGILGAILVLAIFALAFWLYREKRPKNARGGRSRKLSAGKTPTRRSEINYSPPPMSENLAMSIDEALAELPAQMMSRSGSLFYSGRAAFHGTHDLYILGLNPGGSPVTQADETIARDVADWRDLPEHWSAYLDESWQGKQPGTHGMQPRMRHWRSSYPYARRAISDACMVTRPVDRAARSTSASAHRLTAVERCLGPRRTGIRRARSRVATGRR